MKKQREEGEGEDYCEDNLVSWFMGMVLIIQLLFIFGNKLNHNTDNTIFLLLKTHGGINLREWAIII